MRFAISRLLAFLLLTAGLHADDAPIAHLTSGTISGARIGAQQEITVFKGIPFAAAPVQELRWKPPQAVPSWEGTRPCTEYGPACPQPKIPLLSADINNQSEDCLYLNVWAPTRPSEKPLPVMVWIHGGAFSLGSSSQAWYNGENLARQNVVVVTLNYRLGLLGFMAHPLLSKESPDGVSGNYGLLDQVFALKWVQQNIAAFGGDPHCVTIFGESAGAASVCYLMVSPLAQGLFHRAIAESGSSRDTVRHLRDRWYDKEPAEPIGSFVAKSLGCDQADSVLEAMRSKTSAEILRAAEEAQSHFNLDMLGPVVDGWAVPDDPNVLWETAKPALMPFMTGTNANELGGIIGDFAMLSDFKQDRDAVLKLFPGDARKRAATVSIFSSAARADANAMARQGGSAFLYEFTRVPPAWQPLGAFHSSEIPFVFGNLAANLKFEPRDHELSKTMLSYWANFARTGNPNGKGLPVWPAHDPNADWSMQLGDSVQARQFLEKSACDGMDQIRAERLKRRLGK